MDTDVKISEIAKANPNIIIAKMPNVKLQFLQGKMEKLATMLRSNSDALPKNENEFVMEIVKYLRS